MKKAFLFAVVFILLFSVFLLFAVFYLNITQMNELNMAQVRNITAAAYTLDDIRSDILGYLQLSVNISSNSTNNIINITDILPAPYTNPTSELSNYQSFITGVYSNQTNLLNSSNQSAISLNTSAFPTPFSIQFINSNSSLNLNYTYTNFNKNELILNGSTSPTNYSITITLNSSCLNSNCLNATWAGGPPNNDSTAEALWHFDEGSGAVFYDSSGNGNNGAFTGNWTTGRFGGGITPVYGMLSNTSDSASLDKTGNHTIEFWFKTTSTSTSQHFIDKSTGSLNTTDYNVYLSSGNKIYGVVANGTNYQNITSATTIQANTWYHVAFVVNGTNLTIYINGVLDNSTAQTLTPLSNNHILYIAVDWGSSQFLRGTIDEVAIYSRAKSADEIAADANLFHWDWSPIAMSGNLAAAWHFDEGTGNSTADSSGNGNTLSFTGTTTINMLPSSSANKAYEINLTSVDNPLLATTELNYSNVNASDGVYELSYASYSNTFALSCQHSGSCSCQGPAHNCWYPDVCTNYQTACSASCPSASNAQTGSTCTASATGCATTCPPPGGCSD